MVEPSEECGCRASLSTTLHDRTNLLRGSPRVAASTVTAKLLRWSDFLLLAFERARQRRLLGCMSDHQLKDIGLSRADVEHEIVKRPWRG